MRSIHTHTFPNGLTLLAEPMPGAESLAMSFLTPAGIAAEPPDRLGLSAMLAEIICRGAGGRSAREHSDALDTLGVDRSTANDMNHLRLSATMIGTKLPDALPLLADMIRAPAFDPAHLPPTRDLATQAIDALADEPQQRAFLELRQRQYPAPFGRSPLGDRDHLQQVTLDDLQAFARARFVPQGVILAFAGRFDWDALRGQVERLLGDWAGQAPDAVEAAAAPRGYSHLHADSAQVHIGVAYDAVKETDAQAVLQRAAAAVLSGGMSGRLFTEVREKRGLCYAVYAMYAGQRDRGAMLAYAGTSTPRAQDTLDVLTQELERLSNGVEPDEFERAIVGMKSRLVMQGESTAARAAAIAADQYTHGRPRTLDERAAEVDAVTLDDLNAFLAEHLPEDMTIVTIGPEPLNA